jgi:hypothetical protein
MSNTPRSLITGALLSVVALVGCGDDSETTGPSDAAGTYQMQSVNGQALPATTETFTGGGKFEYTAGTFVLRGDKTYTETINTRTTAAGGTVTTDSAVETGTYVRNGETIQFTIPATATVDAFSYEGTLSGSTLSYTFSGIAVLYKK